MAPVYYSTRISDKEICPKCQHMITMISYGPRGEQRQCLKCSSWFDIPVTDMELPWVAARTIDVLLRNGLVNTSFHSEDRVVSEKHVHQFRLEFEMPDKWRGSTASVRWFILPKKADYQYLNKVRKGRLENGHLPAFVYDGTKTLTKRDQSPGGLYISEAYIDCREAGRKYVRLEQSYYGTNQHDSLILRVELAWHHDPRDGIQPPRPWDRV